MTTTYSVYMHCKGRRYRGGRRGSSPPTLAGEGAEHPQNTNTAKLNLATILAWPPATCILQVRSYSVRIRLLPINKVYSAFQLEILTSTWCNNIIPPFIWNYAAFLLALVWRFNSGTVWNQLLLSGRYICNIKYTNWIINLVSFAGSFKPMLASEE